jgi:hypothetical protein
MTMTTTTTAPRLSAEACELLHQTAHRAGMAAATATKPTPMTVQEHASPLDDRSAVTREWFVSEGVCGFAWVTLYPATSSFARWAKKQGLGHRGYYGGFELWVSQFDRSMDRKEAYAHAYARVLQESGLRAYAGSRMD